ncbi:hypothetical protein SAMN04488156_13515 [Bacillus sp. 166amftsu]|nr:hypothetical protein SAMN04488156_13515 [Bacillus sp. 166amftsu]
MFSVGFVYFKRAWGKTHFDQFYFSNTSERINFNSSVLIAPVEVDDGFTFVAVSQKRLPSLNRLEPNTYQVGESHLRVSFLFSKGPTQLDCNNIK